MIKKYSMILLLVLLFVTQAACSSSSPKSVSANASSKSLTSGKVLYQNSHLGLTLNPSGDWKKKSDTTNSKGSNLVFVQNQLRVVVSVIPKTNTFNEIKATLIKSVVHPKVINQTDSYLNVESGLKDPIQVISYLKQKGNHDYVFSFVTSTKLMSQNKPVMENFMKDVQIN